MAFAFVILGLLTTEFVSLERRKIVKRAVQSLGLGWTLGSVRKDLRMGVWNLTLVPEAAPEPSQEDSPPREIPAVLGDAEMEGLEQGGPAGDRALAKIRKAIQLRTPGGG